MENDNSLYQDLVYTIAYLENNMHQLLKK